MSEKGCLKDLIVEDIEIDNLTLKGNIKFKGYKFPINDGNNEDILKTDGNSTPSWSENVGSLQKDTIFPHVPAKSDSAGNVLYVDENKSVKIKKNDGIWYTFGEINEYPIINVTPSPTYTLHSVTPTYIDVRAKDPEKLIIIYSLILQEIVNGVWKTITISDLSLISSITESSITGNDGLGAIKRYTISPNQDVNNFGEFKLIISVTDGINITNTSSIIGIYPATGGIFNTYSDVNGNKYKVHIFLEGGNFIVNVDNLVIDFLIVGGGGGGASKRGGGGGAGGVVIGISQTINTGGDFPIIIGNGGAGMESGNSGIGVDGNDSTFKDFVAKGGGGGGGSGDGNIGGSGGGCRGNRASAIPGTSNQDDYDTITNVSGYGNSGGNPSYNGPGGGGAGSVGYSGDTNKGGNAGSGMSNSFKTGNNLYYGGGGGGGGVVGGGGSGGSGGGGNGGGSTNLSTPGSPNTGGGGGAGGSQSQYVYSNPENYAGKQGGSGIVVIRYVIS
jgi:hypothetical protein